MDTHNNSTVIRAIAVVFLFFMLLPSQVMASSVKNSLLPVFADGQRVAMTRWIVEVDASEAVDVYGSMTANFKDAKFIDYYPSGHGWRQVVIYGIADSAYIWLVTRNGSRTLISAAGIGEHEILYSVFMPTVTK